MTTDEMKQIKGLIDDSAVETKRHFDVVGESLRAKIQIVAEGHVMLNEKMDRRKIEDEERHQEVTGRLDRLEVRVGNVEDRVEALDHKVEALDHKVEALDHKVEALDQKVEGIDGRLGRVERDVGEMRDEMRSGFEELRSAIRFSYAEVDRRVSTLESELASLSHRVERVEALVVH